MNDAAQERMRRQAEAMLESLDTKPCITWMVPVQTATTSQAKGHWKPRSKRAKEQRAASLWSAKAAGLRTIPRIVRLTRIAPGSLDSDNLPASMKHVRDGIADALETDDSERAGIVWTYAQEQGKAREYAVRVEVWL